MAIATFEKNGEAQLLNWTGIYEKNIKAEEQHLTVAKDFTHYVIEHQPDISINDYVPELSKYIYFNNENEYLESLEIFYKKMKNKSENIELKTY